MKKLNNLFVAGLMMFAVPVISTISGLQSAVSSASAAAVAGQTAPDFTFPVNGTMMHLSDLRGYTVVLDFWASWCPWCAKSLLQTEAVDKKYTDVVVIGLDNEDSNTIAQASHAFGLTFPTFQDTRGAIANEYGADAIPYTVVIGPNGTILSVISGYHDNDPLDNILASLGE